MHAAGGRETSTVTGCVRNGVKTWHILEIILFELIDSTAVRTPDSQRDSNFWSHRAIPLCHRPIGSLSNKPVQAAGVSI